MSVCDSLSETVKRSEEYLKKFEESHGDSMQGQAASMFKVEQTLEKHTDQLEKVHRRLDADEERLDQHESALLSQQKSVGDDMNARLVELQRSVEGIKNRVENELSE